MNSIKCLVSLILYWVGHLFSLLELYRPYSWCMCKLSDFDTGECGIWTTGE